MRDGKAIKLEGMNNFRELGGYPTQNGKTIKEGIFYRSGQLGTLTRHDLEIVNSFHIRTILDLRSKSEIRRLLPDPVIEGADYIQSCPMLYSDGSEVDFSPEGIRRMNIEFGGSKDAFVQLNINTCFNNSTYQKMFQLISDHEVPILFHCTAGKDRTGFATALIMLALGCDEDTVVYDYLLTNVYRESHIQNMIEKNKKKIEQGLDSEEKIRIREGVHERTIRMAMEEIKKRYGDYDSYFQEEYHLDLEKIRREYLD